MLSYSPFSSSPYSALAETLIEIDATLDNISLFNSYGLSRLLGISSIDINSRAFSDSKISLYSSYDFLTNSEIDISSKLKNYNLSTFESRFQAFQSAIIKFKNSIDLNSVAFLDSENKIKLSNYLDLISQSTISFETKIKISSDSNFLIEALLQIITTEVNTVEASALLGAVLNLLSSPNIKFYNSSTLNNISNVDTSSILKFYNNSDFNFSGMLEGNEKLFINSYSDLELKSEFLSQYFIKTNGSILLDNNGRAIFNSFIKNYNISNLATISNLDLFGKLVFSNNESIFNFNLDFISNSKIKTFSNSNLDNEVQFLSTYLNRVIGNFSADIDFNFSLNPNYKTYGDWIINSNVVFESFHETKFYGNTANFDIVGILASNLSQRNRDVVYYILAIDQERPFELQILRSK